MWAHAKTWYTARATSNVDALSVADPDEQKAAIKFIERARKLAQKRADEFGKTAQWIADVADDVSLLDVEHGWCSSCFVKSEQLASQLSPYILIVQLLFSGVLFPMDGAASTVSALMLSRWGMEALGSSCDLNELPLRMQEEIPLIPIPHEPDDAFSHDVDHLLVVWLIMLAFIIVPIVIGNFGLHRVKHDSRD
jgi:hypothetical protein